MTSTNWLAETDASYVETIRTCAGTPLSEMQADEVVPMNFFFYLFDVLDVFCDNNFAVEMTDRIIIA